MAATGFYLGAGGEWIGAPMRFDTLSISNLFNKKHVPVPLPPGWKWLIRGRQVTGDHGCWRPGSTQAASRLQQAKYGHRGDAHIGEASHPGPKRMSLTDEPDVDAGWACSVCTSWNHELMKSCEFCERVKRPRRTKTGVGAATQTRTAPTSALAPDSVVTPVAPPAQCWYGCSAS